MPKYATCLSGYSGNLSGGINGMSFSNLKKEHYITHCFPSPSTLFHLGEKYIIPMEFQRIFYNPLTVRGSLYSLKMVNLGIEPIYNNKNSFPFYSFLDMPTLR